MKGTRLRTEEQGASQPKRRGRPSTGSTPVNIRFNDELLADLDAWIQIQPEPKLIRTQAIRYMVASRLVKDGIRRP